MTVPKLIYAPATGDLVYDPSSGRLVYAAVGTFYIDYTDFVHTIRYGTGANYAAALADLKASSWLTNRFEYDFSSREDPLGTVDLRAWCLKIDTSDLVGLTLTGIHFDNFFWRMWDANEYWFYFSTDDSDAPSDAWAWMSSGTKIVATTGPADGASNDGAVTFTVPNTVLASRLWLRTSDLNDWLPPVAVGMRNYFGAYGNGRLYVQE